MCAPCACCARIVHNRPLGPNVCRGSSFTNGGCSSQPSKGHDGMGDGSRAVLKEPDFFFVFGPPLRTAPRDHQPPTANSHQPPTANRHQPPTTDRHQLPPKHQRRPTANRQPLPTATNHQSPTTNRRQQPPTATNRQLPTANRQSPPTANRQPPPTMVEHMECPRALLGKLCNGTLFFSVKDRPGW